MSLRQDSDPGDWRRRAQSGSRDIFIAVTLTVLALGLIGLAWLGNGARQIGQPVATVTKDHP